MPRPHARSAAALALALVLALASARALRAQSLDDPLLDLDLVTGGLSFPTSMAFLGPDDFLVLEKNTGNVRRVVGGVLAPLPVLSLPINFLSELGLLGIAIDTATPRHAFIYYTAAETLGGPAIANRVVRFTWNPFTSTLVDPTPVLELPVGNANNHQGGVVVLGPPGQAPGVGDGSLLYTVVGDEGPNPPGQLQNVTTGVAPNDSSVILRVRQNGAPAPGNPFTPYCSVTTATTCTIDANCPVGETCVTKVARYYAYGVRNSFGLALDPATGALWDTENGPVNYDEVNRVDPGMNSGWLRLMGPSSTNPGGLAQLFHMPGAGSTYSEPELSFAEVIAPTAIVFPRQTSLGPRYDHVAIIGDVNTSRLYRLPLNGARTGFNVGGLPGLSDLVADNLAEREQLRMGVGFFTSDLEVGPDGDVYVVAIYNGAIYRIAGALEVPALPVSAGALLAALLLTGGLVAVLARRAPRA